MSKIITAQLFVRLTANGRSVEFPMDDGDSYREIFQIAHAHADGSPPEPKEIRDEPPGRRARLWGAAMQLREFERVLGVR